MDFSNSVNMEMGGKVENEDDLQVLADNVVQEESEELVFEETESDVEVDDDMQDEKPKKGFTIMGFTLEQNHIYMLVGLLLVVVFLLYKDQILEFINELFNKDGVSAEPVPEPLKK